MMDGNQWGVKNLSGRVTSVACIIILILLVGLTGSKIMAYIERREIVEMALRHKQDTNNLQLIDLKRQMNEILLHKAVSDRRQFDDMMSESLRRAHSALGFLAMLTNPKEVARHVLALRLTVRHARLGSSGNRGAYLPSTYSYLLQGIAEKLAVNSEVLLAAKTIFFGSDATVLRAVWGDSLVRDAVMAVAEENKSGAMIFVRHPQLLTAKLPEKGVIEKASDPEADKNLLLKLGITDNVSEDDMAEIRYYIVSFYQLMLDSSPAAVDVLRTIIAEIVRKLFHEAR